MTIKSLFENKRLLTAVYTLLALTAGIHALYSGLKYLHEPDLYYSFYNNYLIFKNAYFHLISGHDLYAAYPEQYWDLYKYSPTFAVCFGILAVLPDWLGLNLWNLLNALLFLSAVYYLPRIQLRDKGIILALCAIEMMTSLQSEQSNGLMAALLIFAYGLLERKKYFWAAFCIVFSVFIKLFGLVGFALFLFYPHKWKLFISTTAWTLILILLPLLFVDISQYTFLFSSWWEMLTHDQATSEGFSVMGWIHAWFGSSPDKLSVVLAGVLLFLWPMSRIKMYSNESFRLLTLASVLIWIVIFNHKAESPTFIIAMSGAALWFVQSEKKPMAVVMILTAFILTSLSPTDLFPRYLRNEFIKPYMLKVLPCILIWGRIVYEMMVMPPASKVMAGKSPD